MWIIIWMNSATGNGGFPRHVLYVYARMSTGPISECRAYHMRQDQQSSLFAFPHPDRSFPYTRAASCKECKYIVHRPTNSSGCDAPWMLPHATMTVASFDMIICIAYPRLNCLSECKDPRAFLPFHSPTKYFRSAIRRRFSGWEY